VHRRPDRLELVEHLGGGDVAGVDDPSARRSSATQSSGSARRPRGRWVSEMIATRTGEER
jgi:hypothetical protein